MANNTRHNILTTDRILPRTTSGIEVGSRLLNGALSNPTVNIKAATPVTLVATDLFNSVITNTGAGGVIAMTLPTAANLMSGLAAIGIVPAAGDVFSTLVSAVVASNITIAVNTGITFSNAASPLTITASFTAELQIRCVSPSVPTFIVDYVQSTTTST
jgi:sorbitol-specific phosphotransferase system component IIBC